MVLVTLIVGVTTDIVLAMGECVRGECVVPGVIVNFAHKQKER